jgi:hypothetical protein
MNKTEHTAQQLDFLFDDGDVFEVCLLGIKIPKHSLWGGEFAGGKPVSGYFNDKKKAVSVIQEADELIKPVGIYLTVNPCKPELLARANNRLLPTKIRTSDADIARIENFFVDLDPKRPTGISASLEELCFAAELSYKVMQDLVGFGRLMYAMSGNGYHLTMKAMGASSDEIRVFLNNISERFTSQDVDIDRTVFNPSRLIKAYGTTARKGESVPETGREHRVSIINEVLDV